MGDISMKRVLLVACTTAAVVLLARYEAPVTAADGQRLAQASQSACNACKARVETECQQNELTTKSKCIALLCQQHCAGN
jgi:hypothetical protein